MDLTDLTENSKLRRYHIDYNQAAKAVQDNKRLGVMSVSFSDFGYRNALGERSFVKQWTEDETGVGVSVGGQAFHAIPEEQGVCGECGSLLKILEGEDIYERQDIFIIAAIYCPKCKLSVPWW